MDFPACWLGWQRPNQRPSSRCCRRLALLRTNITDAQASSSVYLLHAPQHKGGRTFSCLSKNQHFPPKLAEPGALVGTFTWTFLCVGPLELCQGGRGGGPTDSSRCLQRCCQSGWSLGSARGHMGVRKLRLFQPSFISSFFWALNIRTKWWFSIQCSLGNVLLGVDERVKMWKKEGVKGEPTCLSHHWAKVLTRIATSSCRREQRRLKDKKVGEVQLTSGSIISKCCQQVNVRL